MGTLRWTDTDHEDYDSQKEKQKNTEESNKIHAKIYEKKKEATYCF